MAVKAMILAAGFGTRLRPLTDTLPKPILPIGGRPIIEYTLRLLKHHGITDVIINLHHLGGKIKDALGDGDRYGVSITYSDEPEILGTGGALKAVSARVGLEDLLVINGDILVEIDLDALVDFHRRKGGIATLVLREDAEVDRYGVVEIDDADRICNLLGSIDVADEFPRRRQMFTGIHLVTPAILSAIPAGGYCSIIDVYIDLLRSGFPLFGQTMTGYWNDIGTPERYQQAERDLQAGRFSPA